MGNIPARGLVNLLFSWLYFIIRDRITAYQYKNMKHICSVLYPQSHGVRTILKLQDYKLYECNGILQTILFLLDL